MTVHARRASLRVATGHARRAPAALHRRPVVVSSRSRTSSAVRRARTRRALPALRAAALLLALHALTLLLVGCAGDAAGPDDRRRTRFDDAVGDTLPAGSTRGYTPIDLVAAEVVEEPGTLRLTLRFTAPVVPWSRSVTNSLDGFVDFDVDRDGRTGIPSAAGEFGGASAIGAEYFLSLRDAWPGQVGLMRVADAAWFRVPAVFDGNTLELRISRSFMPDPDGAFDMAIVVGHPGSPATDFAPNRGAYSVVP